MKYANWSLVYNNDPNNEALNKAAEKIIDLLGQAEDEDSCIVNCKEEKELVFIAVEPISNLIQVFHHLTQVGGSIANPTTMMVAIMGFNGDAPVIRVEDEVFVHQDEVKLPAWTVFKTITTATAVKDLREPPNAGAVRFRTVLPIPPLLIPTFLSPASSEPADLFVDCIAAIKAYDTTHQGDTDFP